jgi:hypothetical protein
MRRLLPAMAVLLLLAPRASAQMASPPQPPPVPAPAAIGARGAVETSYLLAAYMTALANAGRAPTPSDIDEATRQYLTNGAAVTGVPSNGPVASYFQNGAAVTGAPSSGPAAAYFHNGAAVLAYPSPVSPATTAPPPPPAVAGPAASDSAPTSVDAGPSEATEEAAVTALAGSVPEADAAASAPSAAASELPAATVATSAPPAPMSPSCVPCSTSAATTPALVTFPATEATQTCPPGPSLLERLVTALGGALVGALAVALWTRPRPPAPPGNERVGAR